MTPPPATCGLWDARDRAGPEKNWKERKAAPEGSGPGSFRVLVPWEAWFLFPKSSLAPDRGGGRLLSAFLSPDEGRVEGKGKTACVLSLPFVLKALPSWNTAQGKFPDREICRLQGPRGGPGPRLFGVAAGKRGWVSRSGVGGRQPAFPAVKELALGASGADSFLSRAGGPRDRSPLSGLGGERPKREREREGRPGAICSSGGVLAGQSTKSAFAK